MTKSRWISLIALSAAVVFLSTTGCVATAPPDGTVYATEAPPAMQVEAAGVAPDAGSVWVGGYYNWAAPSYVWVPGTWQHPPREHAVWVAPEWRHHSKGWWRVDGHWR
jgi:hypothetical protein